MKLAIKIILGVTLLAIVAVVVTALVLVGPLSFFLNQKPENGSKWVYSDYTLDTEATSSAGISIVYATAESEAQHYQTTVYDVTDPDNPEQVTYYDALIFCDGTVQRQHFERKLVDVNGKKIYAEAAETTVDCGTYSGKKITLEDDSFEEAYIRNGVLYVHLKLTANEESTLILKFKPAQE